MTEKSGADRISVTGLEVFAHHGVFDEEKERGQRFLVDLTVHTDTRPMADRDDLDRAVDYGALADLVVETVASTRFNLIESVAARVADVVLHQDRVEMVEVTIHKPDAPIAHPFRDVAVTISRHRAS